MDEQVIDDLYNRAVSQGYGKTRNEFVKLLQSDEDVFNDMYSYVKESGYGKSPDDFSALIGKKKVGTKVPSAVAPTALPLEDGSLESAPTEKLMVGPMGMTGIERTSKYVPAKEQGKQGTILNAISSLDKGFYKNLVGSPVKGLGTALEGVTGKGFVSDALIKFGDYFNKTIDELTPQDEEFKNSLTDQFGQAFGQVASLILTQGAAGALGKAGAATELAAQIAPKGSAAIQALKTFGSELASPTAISAGLSMGQSEFDRAKEAGASDDQAFEAFYKNAAVGSVLEKIPVMQFLKRFEKASAGGIANYLKTKSVSGLVGGVEEMTTEVLQQLYANKTAQDIYNINQDLFEGVGESGGVGFGVGFLLNAMGANAKLLRKQGRDEEAAIIENQMAQFDSKASSTPPPIYKVNGVKVELPALNDIIDNTTAEDLTKLNIEITNDVELRDRLQDKIVTSSIMEQVREANPDLNEPSLKAITELEKQLQKLEGNRTQSGKDKAASIREQIKTIQENPLTEEVVAESTTTLEQELREKLSYQTYENLLNSELAFQRNIGRAFLADPKAFFEKNINDAKEGLQANPNSQVAKDVLDYNTEQLRLFNEITNKYTTNAIQEQGTATGVPSTEQPQLGLQEMGEGNAQPQGTPPGTQEVIAPEPGQEEELTKEKIKTLDNAKVIELAKLSGIESNWDMVGEGDFFSGTTGEDVYTRRMLPEWNRASRLGQINPDSNLTYGIVEGQYGGKDNNQVIQAKDENGVVVGKIVMDNDGGILHLAVAPEFRGKGVSENLYNALKEKNPNVNLSKTKNRSIGFEKSLGAIGIVEAYNRAKQDGSNPELVTAVEQLVSSKTQPTAEVAPATTAETATITAPEVVVEPVVTPAVEPVVEEEPAEEYEPVKVEDTSNELFTKDNATDYEEGERESDNGRTYTYLAMVKVPLYDADGNTIGYLIKLTDDDKELSWQAQNLDQEELNLETYSTKGEAKQAIVDDYNKKQKKEFDKEAKKAAKKKINDAAKAAAKAEKAAAKKAEKAAKESNKKPKLAQDEQVQPQRTGDGTGRTDSRTIAPLEGAPSVQGVNGPDPQLVTVAEQYAEENGIPFKRQSEYVKVDEKRASDIANAYEEMVDDPQNPTVKEAYQNLIKQTIAQYEALVKAGYKFWFMDLNIPSNVEYASSPYNAMRDMRQNKQMGVFPTTDGYGASGVSELDVNSNPLLADTGIQWAVGGLDGQMKNVLANDLFRAVHDAFGHGLEGAGFRARGEENAWQAHVRLFTGSAIGAITSETRGQNSWLNYGPNGEQNRKAKVEDTIFAEQKIGLMPEWTWKEGLAGDMQSEQQAGTLEALMDADVTTEENKNTILDFLNKADDAITNRLRGGANDALLAIPLSTVQLVVKSLKVLVKGGMMLRDAIRKVAADNGVSQEIVKDILNISEIQDKFDALMLKVDEMVNRQRARGTAQDRMVSNIDTYVRKSEVYQEANDAQKKILEREARARGGAAERRAPSIGRILGVLKDITNVSREDKLKIISQIRQLAKGAAQELANEIRELSKSGKITSNQAANIVSRFGKVNMLSEISVSKFVDYMTKVFNDADYANKLSIGNSLKKDLSKLSRNKDKNANLRDLAKEFVKINPSMVDNIDAYNEMASRIKEAIVGSKIKGENVSFAATVDIKDAIKYINNTLAAQLEKLRKEKIAQIQELMGIDASTFSYDDMMMLLEKDKPITKYNEGIIRDTINNMFDVFSSMIDKTISTGKDVFTGEDVFFTESQKDVVKRFMAMDLNTLNPKDALQAVDALVNFLQNQSTAKMETIVSKYTGIQNAKKVKAKGIKAFPLKKYWSKTIGKILGEQTTNLNVLFERMFKGFNAGGYVMDMMGLTKLINNKSVAEIEANKIVKTYVDLFYDKIVNGEAFNTAYNNIERGMAAFMMRNVIGTEEEMKKEFNRRMALIEESIDVLSKGNEKEVAKAELYQKVYDKILKDSKKIDDIKSKIDKINLNAIDFWMNEWDQKFDKLSDVAENVYNKTLDKDLNYTPDKFFKLSSNTGTVVIDDEDSAFLVNSGINNLYQRETGVLMNAVRPESLPTDPDNGDANMYIDLSFDNNNSNSMYDALVDINTAAPIRQVQAFLNSADFKNIVPDSDNAKILKSRIQLYVRNIRDKNPFTNDELSSMVKKLNKVAAIGVGQALGGITQPLKQVIPVAINTLINGGGLDIMASFDVDKNNFINNSGYSIANRGIESQAQVESLNKLIEEVSKSKGEKLLNKIEDLNRWWLKKFLVNPDVFIARASWMTYYEQYLNKNGIETKGLDYSTHQIDEDAANYAQRMVDRQQNVSDIDLAGKLFSNKESSSQILVKTLMPFASFRMNQSARLGADLATLTNKTSTKEDKKVAARSIGGFAAEMVTFRAISIGIALLLGSLSKAIMGKPEDDEEYEKRKKGLIKGALTGTFTDVFSPVPVTDKFVQLGGAPIMQFIEDATSLPVSIYSPRKEEFLQNAGLFGIVGDRASQLYDITKLAVTGKYTDDFGKEKVISSKDKDGLALLIAPALLTNVGLAPSEVNSIIRYAIKDAKKKTKSESEKMQSAETKKVREESKNQKIEALNNLRQTTQDQELRTAINDKIRELNANDEQKKEMKEENAREKEIKKKLLVDTQTGEEYDTESELKRYNKALWDKNFGPDSEWYRSHEDEDEVTKLLNKEIRRMEDEEYGYTPKSRRKKSSSFGAQKKGSTGFGSQGKKSSGFGAQNKSKSGFGFQ